MKPTSVIHQVEADAKTRNSEAHVTTEKPAIRRNLVWQSLAMSPRVVQAKLAISQPDDPYEVEAERVADRVMRMAAPEATQSRSSPSHSRINELQRKCDGCEEEEREDDDNLLRKEQAPGSESPATAPSSVEDALKSPGDPLDPSTRSLMEQRFDRDFASVRVHTDAQSAESARAVNAVAYTVGQNIVFGAGQFAPDTPSGKNLLAHELVHVVQQTHRSIDPRMTEPADSHAEREAHEFSARVVNGERTPVSHATPAGITRDAGFAGRGPIPDAYGMGYNQILTAAGPAAEPAVRDLASCEGRGMTLDLARFEAMPATRRRAILNLAPHAAGTACESWFHDLRVSHFTLTAEGMRGNLYWAGNSGADPADQYQIRTTSTRRTDVNYQTGRETNTNDFAVWMRGGAQPSLTSKMNCWEAIMFGAFRAGLLTEARLRQLHVSAAAAGVTAAAGGASGTAAYQNAIGAFLGLPASRPLTATAEPRRGDLVFFGGLDHVALSIGNETVGGVRRHNVMSLWHLPGAGPQLVSVYQRTSVEDLVTAAQTYLGMTLGTVTFGPAPWL